MVRFWETKPMPDQDSGVTPLAWLDAGLAEQRWPEPGARAVGQGIVGVIVAVPDMQPLAIDDIWRVTLQGELFGRLVGRRHDGPWRLLRADEMTDEQIDVLKDVLTSLQDAA